MITAYTVAQAKVNLGLQVLAREASGYHAIETVFHRLELADEVRIRRTEGEKSLVVTGPALPHEGLGPASTNLAWRAAEAYQQAAGWDGGFAIELRKCIPVGGGLGGGSADAGAILRACDRLAEQPLGRAPLQEIAASLGSDVPFLTSEATAALAWGRGERLLEVPPLPPRRVALVVPTFSVSTAAAYGWLAERRGGAPPAPSRLPQPTEISWESFAAAENDFEPVVGARHPEAPALLATLRKLGAAPAMLSGSGSTVFGVFDGAQPTDIERRLAKLVAPAAVIWTRTAARVVPVAVTG